MRYLFLFILPFVHFYSIGQSQFDLSIDKSEWSDPTKESFVFIPDLSKIKEDLKQSPRYDAEGIDWIQIQIPFQDGVYHLVELAEAPVVAEEIYNRYPENRSYKVRGVDDPYISGRLSLTNRGMTGLLSTKHGHIYIEPIDTKNHKAYRHDPTVLQNFSCGTDHSDYKKPKGTTIRESSGDVERKYRIAIASTGEFSAKHGNTLANVNAIITDYLTLLNTIYERDLSVTFELIGSNDNIIFFDPSSDGLDPTNSNTQLSSAQSVIGSTIGSANYDIGHVFHELSPPMGGWTGSGVATLGTVCSSSTKARGWSACGGPYPNDFWMGIFAHEVGHQFAATHTFYGTSANCGGSQRSVGNGVEPGSGNSLMSYEGSCFANGSCTNQNITPGSGFYYFHGHSIEQVNNFIASSGSCFTSTSSMNSPPVITMPSSKTIPTETPFFLSASATDSDGDPLLYSWEEVDTDNLVLSCPNGAPNDAATSTTAPLFRSFDPSADGSLRYFPKMSDILDDTQTLGEILPEVGRTIDMRFSARGIDANGISGVTYEDVTIIVAGNSGPFEVTTASTPTGYLAGASVNVEWLVNNTNIAPVSCSNVNILFSSDGGNSFPITLASNVPNDGFHPVTMPGAATVEGRIKVEAVDNIFFAINKGDISIISDCEPNPSEIINADPLTADPGDPSLNLGLIVGDVVTSVSESLSSSDPSSTLIAESGTTGNCTTVPTTPYYETYTLIASEDDTYTFTISGNFAEIMNVYQDEYVIPVVNCLNWLGSTATYTPPSVSLSNTISVTLNAEDVVELVVSGLFTGETGNFDVNFSSSGTGEFIDTGIIPVGYGYTYVIYNSAGTIIGIEDEADLSDASIYSSDVYTVKGLMVISTADLSSYIGQPFASMQSDIVSGTVCGSFSSNDVTVTINGCTSGTQLVTSLADNGTTGTLRYIIEQSCENDTLFFDPSLTNGIIVLNSEIPLTQDVFISGLGSNSITLSGNNNSRIFNVSPGVEVSILDVSLINGYSLSNGGAILNNGTLNLENVRFAGNTEGATPRAFTNLNNISVSESVNIEE